MIRKIISCVLCSFLALYTGCYSTAAVTQDELKEMGKLCDLNLTMKDLTEYTFLEGNYHITGDSLSGYGLRKRGGNSDIVLDVSLSLNDFQSMEMEQINTVKTTLLAGGITMGALIITTMIINMKNGEGLAVPSGGGNP